MKAPRVAAIQSELEAALATRPGIDAARAHALFEQGVWGAEPALSAGVIDPGPLVSHHMSLEEAPEAYAVYDRREALKIVLTP